MRRALPAFAVTLVLTACSGGGTTTPIADDGRLLEVGLAIRVLTTSGVRPATWAGLGSWERDPVAAWIDNRINPVFAEANVRIDPARVTVVLHEWPAAFDLQNAAEVELFERDAAAAADEGVLNLYAVNSCTVDGLVGQSHDLSCDSDNRGRMSWVAPLSDPDYQVKLIAHEIGHLFSLPHIRTALPTTPGNDNLMSYGTTSLVLSRDITREDADSLTACSWHQPARMDQLAVLRAWVLQNF